VWRRKIDTPELGDGWRRRKCRATYNFGGMESLTQEQRATPVAVSNRGVRQELPGAVKRQLVHGGPANIFCTRSANPSHWVERCPLERADGVCENQEHGYGEAQPKRACGELDESGQPRPWRVRWVMTWIGKGCMQHTPV
jgi:hypothetical protein